MNVLGIIFANDANLDELTSKRTMASIPFAGRYRQVDFALSNLTCAGVRRIGLVSRSNYQSLMNHIGSGEEWGLELEQGGLEFLTPYAMSTTDSYRGKLESLYSALEFMTFGRDDDYVIMTDTAILCNIDIEKVLDSHIASGRDITIVTKAGVADGKRQLDLALKLDNKGEVADIAVDYAAPADYLSSMDIFVMGKDWLVHQIKEHIARNRYHMDRDLVLGLWQAGQLSINIYTFEGVALYNESVEDYFRNSLTLVDPKVRQELFNGAHPIYTKVRDRVPSYYGDACSICNCIVADGCMLEGNAKNSVLFRNVAIAPGAEVDNCVIMNDSVVGENSLLQYVILDKDVVVRPNAKLIGAPNAPIIIKRGEIV